MALGDEAFLEPARWNVKVYKKVYDEHEESVEEVLEDEEEVEEADVGDGFRGPVFDVFWKGEVEEKVLQSLVFDIDKVEWGNTAISNHDNNLGKEDNHHIFGKLINSEDLSQGLAVIPGLELHHIIEEEDIHQDEELYAWHEGVEVFAGFESAFGEDAVEEWVLWGLAEGFVDFDELLLELA